MNQTFTRAIVFVSLIVTLLGYSYFADTPPWDGKKLYSVSVWEMKNLGKSFYIIPPKVVRDSLPEYPVIPKKMGLNGKVLIEVFINEKGEVEATHILSSTNHIFDESVLKAAKSWTFKPTTTNQGASFTVFFTRSVTFLCEQADTKEKVRLVNLNAIAVIRLYQQPDLRALG